MQNKTGEGSIFILTIPTDDVLMDEYIQAEHLPKLDKQAVEQRINESEIILTPVKDLVIQAAENRKLILLIDDNPINYLHYAE